jgi:hypothetical protein
VPIERVNVSRLKKFGERDGTNVAGQIALLGSI